MRRLFLFSLFFFLFFHSSSSSRSSSESHIFIYGGCSPEKYTPNTPFESNRDTFLSSVVTSSSDASFNSFAVGNDSSSSSSTAVFGLYQCRDDLRLSDCTKCIQNSVDQITLLCPYSYGASLQLEGCFLRYETNDFLGKPDTSLRYKKCSSKSVENDYDFFKRRDDVLSDLESTQLGYKVSRSGLVEGYAQCLGDLSPSDCTACLSESVGKLKNLCGSAVAAEVFLAQCYARYWGSGYYDFSSASPKHKSARPHHGPARPYNVPVRPNQSGGMLVSWNPARSRADFVVAKDGSATHRSVKEALAAVSRMGKSRSHRVIIYIKAGVYNEKIEIDRDMKNIMLVGDGMDRTIITNNRNVPDGSTTYGSATFGVSGDGFWARDMTFENTAGPQKHQAVALRVNSDLSVFYRCSFKGYQDTLFTHSLRQFYRDCHIYGTIDFIFGDAAAVFQNCDIFVRRPMDHQGNMITAQGRDDPHENTGISIQHSRVRAAPEFEAVKGRFKSYLGRPWKKYARTVFLKTDIDGLIDPRGWTEWRGDFALSTLYYGEFMNTGAGAGASRRVNWPGFHLLHGENEASPFTVSRFIQGDSWIPLTGVPFLAGV